MGRRSVNRTILTVVRKVAIAEVVAQEKGIRRSRNALLVNHDVSDSHTGKSTSRVTCSCVWKNRACLAGLGCCLGRRRKTEVSF